MDGERRQQRGGDQHRREYIEAGKTGRLPGSHLIELSNSRRQSVDLARVRAGSSVYLSISIGTG
jgi:hypothetical protein